MSGIDILLGGIVLLAVIFAVVRIVKNMGKGCSCGECSSCGGCGKSNDEEKN